MSKERRLASPLMRVIGGGFLMLWIFAYGILLFKLLFEDLTSEELPMFVGYLVGMPYMFLLMAPPIVLNRYPNWVKKLIPRRMINLMYIHMNHELLEPVPETIPKEDDGRKKTERGK